MWLAFSYRNFMPGFIWLLLAKICKKEISKNAIFLHNKSKADIYPIELDPWAESKPVFWSRTEAIM